MIREGELSEYRQLYASLVSLHEKFMEKGREMCLLLEETASVRRKAIQLLARANNFTGHLSSRQRELTGLSYYPAELSARISDNSPPLFLRDVEYVETLPKIPEDFKDRIELKQRILVILGLIDELKAKLLRLDLLDMRCRELTLSINKALKAFRRESRLVQKKIYPYWIFSMVFRHVRKLMGKSYFTYRDLDGIAAFGNITGLVLKIADSPLF